MPIAYNALGHGTYGHNACRSASVSQRCTDKLNDKGVNSSYYSFGNAYWMRHGLCLLKIRFTICLMPFVFYLQNLIGFITISAFLSVKLSIASTTYYYGALFNTHFYICFKFSKAFFLTLSLNLYKG
ncbi:MAG: hypothetical protein WCH34_06985 [Bacteroidota bacterium]